ncbi:MAG TPA: CTP synthase [Candidatus Portnoybacteria bacterium]|uniref:CTP synthase n=1 Tax=Candidatus Portnoybacteria bacterium CG02_land_8_20_14_3_00_45_8 TaxID=1974807 RepID=A0A2M7D6Q2_9BACT|nr:MAG: CTP synthase [Candidatus Portnoybacteria bacterium CG02_land_8_20_14_3_00_45_8]HCX27884.1 CTP synthase [Candidatus Portnoybacteria bacterium]
MAKYIFVAGGVMSGVGKGVATASIGKLIQSRGFAVTAIKIDPYVNVDAGTMNPTEHGEVFVLDEGIECDQDMGNYERFLDINLPAINYMTTGSVYESVIHRERNMGYGGRCVEVVPHIPLEVIERIDKALKKAKADFITIEIGGTVGEYQNVLFLEAARMLKLKKPKDVLFVLVSYLPVPSKIGEMKTKPTQYAVRTLNSAGIQPDIILARSSAPLDSKRKEKIAFNCNVRQEDVISAPDIETIYEVPLNFERDKLSDLILKKLGVKAKKTNLNDWRKMTLIVKTATQPVKIGIVGKYFGTGDFTLSDAYLSVIEAIKHAAFFHKRRPVIDWLNAEEYEKNPGTLAQLKKYDGIIVPGGFGLRGVEGKIKAIEFCRKNKIPYLGLCYGMQLACVEFARNVCGLKNAHSTEINKDTPYPIIDLMLEQKALLKKNRYGGTMRLGAYYCRLISGTKAAKAYGRGRELISERHRHRYELNNEYRDLLVKNGLVVSGVNPERDLVEIIELKNHPFFVAVQFHPEFKSRPLIPHPLFREFIKAAFK